MNVEFLISKQGQLSLKKSELIPRMPSETESWCAGERRNPLLFGRGAAPVSRGSVFGARPGVQIEHVKMQRRGVCALFSFHWITGAGDWS